MEKSDYLNILQKDIPINSEISIGKYIRPVKMKYRTMRGRKW